MIRTALRALLIPAVLAAVACGQKDAPTGTTAPASAPKAVSAAPATPIPAGPAGLYARYDVIRLALAGDSITGVTEQAKAIAAEKTAAPEMAAAAEKLAAATDPKSARGPFEELSTAAISRRNAAKDAALRIYYCPMVNKRWLQPAADRTVGNPYDPSMRECGYEVDEKGAAVTG